MSNSRKRWLGIGFVVLATLCWSTSGVLITFIVDRSGVQPMGLAFLRVLSACLILLVGILIVRPQALRVQRADLPWLAAMGVLAVGSFQVLWILAILTNGASISTVIQSNAPIIVTLMAWLIWREPLTKPKWAAIGLATIGTVLVSGLAGAGSIRITPAGLFISLGSALTYAGITLSGKKLTGHYNPFVILMYSFGFAAVALLPFQFGGPLLPNPNLGAVVAFAGFVLLTTIAGYASYLLALRYLEASVAAIIAMSEVPVAAFLAYVVLKERLSPWQVLGAVVVVCGVVVLTASGKASERRNPRLDLAAVIDEQPIS